MKSHLVEDQHSAFGMRSGIFVETSEPMHMRDVIETVIQKHKYGVRLGHKHHIGSFDWASDTYIKDAIEVSYSVK